MVLKVWRQILRLRYRCASRGCCCRRSPPLAQSVHGGQADEAGISATPAKEAKAASERSRPESDQLKDLRCGVRPEESKSRARRSVADDLEEFGFQLVGLGLEAPDTLGQ